MTLKKRKHFQIPYHDLPADELIKKLETVKHKATLDEAEAALFLNISLNAIRALRYKRQISFHKNGKRIHYSMADLKTYLQRNRVPAFGTLPEPACA